MQFVYKCVNAITAITTFRLDTGIKPRTMKHPHIFFCEYGPKCVSQHVSLRMCRSVRPSTMHFSCNIDEIQCGARCPLVVLCQNLSPYRLPRQVFHVKLQTGHLTMYFHLGYWSGNRAKYRLRIYRYVSTASQSPFSIYFRISYQVPSDLAKTAMCKRTLPS